MLAALPLPDVTYRGGLTLWPGAREASRSARPPGHTGGDSIVFLPAADVVFAGDLFWKDTLPNLIDANTKEWIRNAGRLPGRASRRAASSRDTARSGRRWTIRLFRDYLVGLRSSVGKGDRRREIGTGR